MEGVPRIVYVSIELGRGLMEFEYIKNILDSVFQKTVLTLINSMLQPLSVAQLICATSA